VQCQRHPAAKPLDPTIPVTDPASPDSPHAPATSPEDAAAQAGSIVQRLVSEAQQNVDDVLQRVASRGSSGLDSLAPQAYDAFSTRWSGLADVLTDPRTGLASRILFWDRICHAAVRHKRYHTRFGVLYIDSGDADERHVPDIALRLGKGLRGNDTIAYAGHGEFTILLDQLQADADALAVADRVREAMTSARQAAPESAAPGRIGVAVFTARNSDAGAVLWDAYAAMQQARPGTVAIAAPRLG
jgi:GGDEF domain-containing protein